MPFMWVAERAVFLGRLPFGTFPLDSTGDGAMANLCIWQCEDCDNAEQELKLTVLGEHYRPL